MENSNITPTGIGAREKQQDNNTQKTGRLTPLQKLTLKFILEHPRCNRWELGGYIESGYSPDLVQYIRKTGIEIITEMVKYVKRSGVKTRIGLYSVDSNSIQKAKRAVYGGKNEG